MPHAYFAADHNFSDMHDERFFLREGLRRRSGGKGKSIEQARASALAESLERYCGVFDGTRAAHPGQFLELGDAAITRTPAWGTANGNTRSRKSHNRRGQKTRRVPEPFREDVEIEWTPLRSLSAEQRATCRLRSAISGTEAPIHCSPEPTPTVVPPVPSWKRPCCRGSLN